jgi:hypothetical protein
MCPLTRWMRCLTHILRPTWPVIRASSSAVLNPSSIRQSFGWDVVVSHRSKCSTNRLSRRAWGHEPWERLLGPVRRPFSRTVVLPGCNATAKLRFRTSDTPLPFRIPWFSSSRGGRIRTDVVRLMRPGWHRSSPLRKNIYALRCDLKPGRLRGTARRARNAPGRTRTCDRLDVSEVPSPLGHGSASVNELWWKDSNPHRPVNGRTRYLLRHTTIETAIDSTHASIVFPGTCAPFAGLPLSPS